MHSCYCNSPSKNYKARVRTYKNKTKHFVFQCLDCGRVCGSIPKIKLSNDLIEKIKPFDESFLDTKRDETHEYFEKRSEYKNNERLKRFDGYDSYYEYLCSEKWNTKRSQRLDIDNGICQLCGEKATHVHHLNYDSLCDENVDYLRSLCEYCHLEAIHDKLNKQETTLKWPKDRIKILNYEDK